LSSLLTGYSPNLLIGELAADSVIGAKFFKALAFAGEDHNAGSGRHRRACRKRGYSHEKRKYHKVPHKVTSWQAAEQVRPASHQHILSHKDNKLLTQNSSTRHLAAWGRTHRDRAEEVPAPYANHPDIPSHRDNRPLT
jgi:hypothetical protein